MLFPAHALGLANRSHLEQLSLVVSRVDALIIVAGLAQKLSPIHRNWCQTQTAIRVHDPISMLPLQDSSRARGILRVCDRTVIGFLVVTVAGEGVGNACPGRLSELVVEGVVEAL